MIELYQQHIDRITTSGNGQYKGICPFHDDTRPSFTFSENGQYQCKACGAKGNAITFAREMNIELPKQDYRPVKIKKKEWTPPGKLDRNHFDQVFLFQDELLFHYDKYTRGLPWNKRMVKILCIGWDNGFTFPYTNTEGDLVNIKWHKKKQVKGHGSTYIFPMWQMVHDYNVEKPLYVVEGEKDVISMVSSGKQAITLNNGAGAKWPEELVVLISDRFKLVYPHYDNDDAGRAAEKAFIERFKPYAVG
jgi:hypothetical protein